MNACFMSQFGYCSLIWINHGRTLNNSISRLHKRALSLVFNDFSSGFSDLLEKDKSVPIYHRNLQTLAYEIFKVKNNMVPETLTEILPQKEGNYSLRNSTTQHGPQRIVHVLYVKRMYKTLNLCKLHVRKYFVLHVEIF